MDQSPLSDFKKFLDQSLRLPVQPRSLLRLLGEDDESACRRKLLEAADFDPVVTAVLLKAVNSPTFRAPERADSASRVEFVDRDVTSVALLSLRVQRGNTGRRFSLSSFRRHSIACAIISELLSTQMGYPSPADAFLGGLLHDLGKIALSEWSPSAYDTLFQRSQKRRIPMLQLEEANLRIGHTLAASLLFEKWNLPVFLQTVCNLHHHHRHHHRSLRLHVRGDQTSLLSIIVQQANRLCHLWQLGTCVPLDEPELFELAAFTNQSPDQFCALFLDASNRLEQLDGRAETSHEATEEKVLDALLLRLGDLQLAGLRRNREIEMGETSVSTPGPGRIACRAENAVSRRGRTVLVVEDDQPLRQLLIEILRSDGYEPEGAADGLEAIRKLIDGHYLAAVLDLQMPRIDGLEVLVTSRRIAPEMPIVVLTGVIGPGGAAAARDAGAFRCLQKPASNQQILKALADAVASRIDHGQQDVEAAG